MQFVDIQVFFDICFSCGVFRFLFRIHFVFSVWKRFHAKGSYVTSIIK